MTPFIPDNFLARLAKKLSSSSRNEALDNLSDDFGDPVFLAQYYIQPHCQFENPDNEDAGERRPVFSTINKFLAGCDGEGDQDNRRNCMFLLGDAGTGKTSLLVMLKLAQLTGLWPSHCHCELMKLGSSTLERIGSIKAPRKTVLLLDALNDDPERRDVLGRVTEIFRATIDFHRVIVSCRTTYSPDGRHDAFDQVGKFTSEGNGCPTVYLSLFNNTQMDKYLKRRFRRMEDPTRKRAKGILGEMGAFRACPLLLSHADDFVHSRCKVWNKFSTYDAMVDAWLTREEGKMRTTHAGAKFSKETLLDASIKLARLMQLNESRRSVSKSEVAESNLDESETDHVESLDCRGRSFLRRDSAGASRFNHGSIQEFLIALGVRNGLLHSKKKRMPATELIISFLIHFDDAATEWRALDLTFASLAGAELHNADFSRSLVVSADLEKCVLNSASFDNADLTSSEAHRAKFAGCSFEFTKAANASWHSVVFSDCRFTSASFAGSVLSNATFDRCKIDHTGLAESNFSNCVFAQSTISECNFKSSRLCASEWRDSALAKVKFDRCSLSGAKFRNTSLRDVSIQSADMRKAELDDAFLDAVKVGAVRNWKTAAWDSAVAELLKLSAKENERNAATIESDLGR